MTGHDPVGTGLVGLSDRALEELVVAEGGKVARVLCVVDRGEGPAAFAAAVQRDPRDHHVEAGPDLASPVGTGRQLTEGRVEVIGCVLRRKTGAGRDPELLGVGPEHAGWGLRGSQAFVAFTTSRYAEYPLVVQGAGAGGDVTASGVLADILRIARGLRGG